MPEYAPKPIKPVSLQRVWNVAAVATRRNKTMENPDDLLWTDILDLVGTLLEASRILAKLADAEMYDAPCGGICNYTSDGVFVHDPECIVYLASGWLHYWDGAVDMNRLYGGL